MNIVHIGSGTTPSEIEHITEHRDAGHDYYVPGDGTYEQLVRRIMDADEIHIFDMSKEFELGMVYFFSVHALHYKLHWQIRLFGISDGPWPRLECLRRVAKDQEAAVLCEGCPGKAEGSCAGDRENCAKDQE